MNRTALWGLGALAVATAFYAPVLAELGRDWWRDPNYSHGLLIPLISAFLIWRQKDRLRQLPVRPSKVGMLGILGALALWIVGAAGAEVFTQRVSYVGLLFSGVVFFLGWGWARVVAFPLALLLLAIPLPYIIYYSLTNPMQGLAAKVAVGGLKVLGVPVVAQGNIIHLPNTTLEVAEACSGIRSLYAFLSLGALLAYWMPVPVWGRVLVFLVTIPLSVVGNAVRVWGTSLGAYVVGPSVTKGLVHELFGLIIFASALVIFILIRKGARFIWSPAPSSSSSSSPPPVPTLTSSAPSAAPSKVFRP